MCGMESARAKDQRWRMAAASFLAATALGATLGVIGPFGSYLNASLFERIAYWVVCLWAGWLAFGVAIPLLARQAQARGLAIWLWTPPAVAALALVPAVISRKLALAMWPVVARVSWPEWYAQGLVISALITLGVLWTNRSRAPAPAGPDPLSADPRDRLPPRLGRTVLCLRMEDHYVRVYTPLGSELVLMSLSQAIAGLKDVEGSQTHRSWWVARAAVLHPVQDGRNLRLKLQGGLEAPVARARVAALKQQGWLGASGEI